MSSYNVVCRILCDSYNDANKGRISKNGASIQERFFEIQKSYPKLLPDLIFDESGITPYSSELEQILRQLEIGEILSTGNPDYKEYQIKNQAYLKDRGSRITNTSIDSAVNIFKTVMVESD